MDLETFKSIDGLNEVGRGYLPELLGLQITHAESGLMRGEIGLSRKHFAPNGYLHAAVIVALADTTCGYGCMNSLPEGAIGFTTIELKSNFLATVSEGVIRAEATLRHGGRRTQVWDAEVTDGAGKTLAIFRCTEMILWPQPGSAQG